MDVRSLTIQIIAALDEFAIRASKLEGREAGRLVDYIRSARGSTGHLLDELGGPSLKAEQDAED